MKWLIIIVAIPVVILGILLLFALFSRPRKYRNVSYQALPALLRELAAPLHSRGTIYLGHAEVEGVIWIRLRRYKTRPDQLQFRFRNTDETRRPFNQVTTALEREGVDFEMELTRLRKRPRAAVIAFDATQATSYSGLAHAARVCFEAMGETQDDKLVVYAEDSSEGILGRRPYAGLKGRVHR